MRPTPWRPTRRESTVHVLWRSRRACLWLRDMEGVRAALAKMKAFRARGYWRRSSL